MKEFWVIRRNDPDCSQEYLMDELGMRIRGLEYPDRLIRKVTAYSNKETKEWLFVGLILGIHIGVALCYGVKILLEYL